MIKFDTLFKRGADGKVIPEINPPCTWVLSTDNGLMTIKLDGVTIQPQWCSGPGPAHWNIRVKEGNDWRLSEPGSQQDKTIWMAWQMADFKGDGIYVVYGKDFKGNPHNMTCNQMIKVMPVDHNLIIARGKSKITRGVGQTEKRLYDQILDEFTESPEIEGLMFHLEDQQMNLIAGASITKKDFGLDWPAPKITIDMSTSNVIPAV